MGTANRFRGNSEHRDTAARRGPVEPDNPFGRTANRCGPNETRQPDASLANATRLGITARSGHARFVGRVGALALALGIGGAIATSPGIAAADDSPASDSSSATSGDQNEAPTAPASTPQTTDTDPSPGDAASPDPGGTDSAVDGGPDTSADDDPDLDAVVAQLDSNDTEPADIGDGDLQDGEPGETDLPDATPEPQPTQAPVAPGADGGSDEHEPARSQYDEPPTPLDTAANLDDPAPGLQVARLAAAPSTGVDAARTAPPEPESDPAGPASRASEISSATTPVVSTPAPVPPPAPDLLTVLAEVPRMILVTAFKVVDAILTPFFGPIPDTPPQGPFLWVVLAWVRREFAEVLGILPKPTPSSVTAPKAGKGVHPPAEGPADPTGLPDDLERTTLVSGLNQPTDFRILPDGRILIAEKGGAIKVYDGQLHDQPLITLAVLPTDTDEERGLLGIEIDPDFEHNGYLYVSYTTAQNFDRLARLTVTGDIADPASEVVLLESDQPGNIYHHGGEVHFGPDGKLYWAMGMNTYNPNSQNLSNVHGKILRLNPDGSAPADNPFVDTPGAVPQIWAYGLRNPFRFTFTPDGQLLTGDVGGDAWEELNVVTRGANYGWPLAEGDCGNCGFANPIYTYHHTDPPAKAGSITSVMVYTADTLGAEYQNKVFIADYTLGWIKELTFDSDFESFISERMFDDQAGTTVKLAQGPDGKIYQLTIYPGVLSVIAPSGGNRAPTAVLTADQYNGLGPLLVNFSSAGSYDPDPGTTLSYAWDFGDGSTSVVANPTKTYTVDGAYTVTLTVDDGAKTGQATQRIVVGSTAPTAQILTPTSATRYNAGDVITFSGLGSDAEDGALPDSAYSWSVLFHHAEHVHPFRDNIIGPTGTITIPRSADNIDTTSYILTLTVTDTTGLSTSRSVEIKPNLVTLTVNASDPEATFTIDGIPYKGSHTEQAVVGVERVISAVSPQYVTDGQFVFNSWSDGLAQSHTIVTPGTNSAYTVNYDKFITPPAPWREGDIGHPSLAGYSSFDHGTFTIRAGGGDIWGPTDEFHYVYQGFSGDGTIITRVTSQTDTDDWAKSGIMIKESAASGAKYVLLAVTPANGVTFQYNFNGDGGSAAYTFPDAWLKLERIGDVFTGYTSANGTDWTMVGQTTLAMATDVTAGLAVVSHKFNALNTSVFDNVSVMSGQEWTSQDIGAVRIPGSATVIGGLHTLTGSGDDIWGEADQFHFQYQTLPGDGTIIAHVVSFTGTTDGWAKAGVMIKQSAAAGASYALLAVTPSNGINLQDDFADNIAGPAVGPAGAWLKLERVGATVTGFSSTDGVVWAEIGSVTVDLQGAAVIGLFVSAHDGSQLSTATFDHVSVSKSSTAALPAPWAAVDVGAPRLAGSASYASGVFTVNGAGDDIWGEADQFHFVHQTLTGDGEITARVTAQETGTDGWAKSGVMIKDSTVAGSPYALLAVTPEHGITFQHDFTGDAGTAPYTLPDAWLRLTRTGDTITASTSADGVTWTEIGAVAVPLASDAEIGIFVSSHNGSQVNTSTFDHVSVTSQGVLT